MNHTQSEQEATTESFISPPGGIGTQDNTGRNIDYVLIV